MTGLTRTKNPCPSENQVSEIKNTLNKAGN
jgi:hypothetical protein